MVEFPSSKRRLLILSAMCLAMLMLVAGCNQSQLSLEERVADFNYLYTVMQENYPFFAVQERLHGITWLDNYDLYLKKVEEARNDKKFAMVLDEILKELRQGHTDLLSAQAYPFYVAGYTEASRPQWAQALQHEKVKARYAGKGSQQGQLASPPPPIDSEAFPSGLTTRILDEGNIAYLAIKSFGGSLYGDQSRVRRFYEEVKDYSYLIIDIRGNSGGNDMYWTQNIMVPLLEDGLEVAFHFAMKDGEHVKLFYGENTWCEWQDIATLPDLPHLPPEIREDFALHSSVQRSVQPDNPVGFQGEIFLLVDHIVFSASESFAAFASASKWATLVGTRTGGDGIGIDPMLIALPNSGYLIRMPGIIALNPDGSVSAEVGTLPDVLINAEEDALQAVLEIIRKR